ncbi:MAG: dihydrolipoyl dehydrogenase family protein [Solirubrobacteraceae bacterium]
MERDRCSIELLRGSARLDGERRVRVGDELLIAREAVIVATGSHALVPPIPGLAGAHAWSNREITTTKQAPERLLILGGGVVGVEMAQAWSSLGSRVTVFEALDRLISREEPVASEQLQEALEHVGVEVRLGMRATEVRRDGEEFTVVLEDGATFTGDRLLMAIGREPSTAGLGLETVGLKDGGYVEVDDRLRAAGSSWLYAIGDANGRALLTHAGKHQARIAADNILGEPARVWSDGARSPRVIFTEPQIAAVGSTLDAAHEAGRPARAIDVATDGNAGASFYGRGTGGTSRFVVDDERRILIGATFIGAEITDFLQAATVAVVGEVPLARLAHAIAPFPTRSEVWLKFIESYERELGVSLHGG